MVIHRCPLAKFTITNNDELICNDYLFLNENMEFTINKNSNIKIEYIDNPKLN